MPEQIAHEQGRVAHFAEGDLDRIQVEQQLVGTIDRVHRARPRVHRDVAEIEEMQKRRQVGADDVVGVPERGMLAADAPGRNPVGTPAGAVFW